MKTVNEVINELQELVQQDGETGKLAFTRKDLEAMMKMLDSKED